MKKLILFLGLIYFQLSWSQNLILEVGQTLDLPLTGSRIWVEKGNFLKAEVRSGRVFLTGKKNGESQIRIGSNLKLVQIVDHEKIKLFEMLKLETAKRPGLRVQLSQGEIEVHGYLHSWESWKSLLKDKVISSHYLMKAQLSASLKTQLQDLINQDLMNQSLLSLNINQEPHFHVRLHPEQQGLDLYQMYFQRLGIPVVLIKESLPMEPSVRVNITVAEVSNNTSRSLGIQWPGRATFDILPQGLVNAENLQATLSALEAQGQAKLLASPNLICRSGKEAEFLAGGEIPIKIKGFGTQGVQWKKYGVLLKIKPFADSSGRISLSLETEVSDVGDLYEGIPSFKSNKVSSHFDLSQSQVIALSGLLRDNTSKSALGLPWLTQVPVLGPLFSSQEYLSQKTELVIFVQPSLLSQKPDSAIVEPQHIGKK